MPNSFKRLRELWALQTKLLNLAGKSTANHEEWTYWWNHYIRLSELIDKHYSDPF